jgi:hypothetical protein
MSVFVHYNVCMKKAIICDLDGTLALLNGRSPFDASTCHNDQLNNPVANLLEVYAHQTLYDISLIFLSGRYDTYMEETKKWLEKHNITHYEHLFLRSAHDKRKDVLFKKEIYKNHIEGKYDVLFVLEDRDQVVEMWRKDLGLTCLQVDYGAF